MTNQYSKVDWKEKIAKTAARLEMCVVLPERFTANARLKCSCPHGVVKETSVSRFVNRQFCCKSQASKAHDKSLKSKAAKIRWRDNPITYPQTAESNLRRSKTLKQTINSMKEEGWYNPGWGYGPSDTEREMPGTLYLVRYLDESGTHFKIGITKHSVSKRFKHGQLISILALHHATLGECFDLEQSILKWAKSHGHRYSSPTTTELIRPEAYTRVLDMVKSRSVTKSYNSYGITTDAFHTAFNLWRLLWF
jgi:hypothetical protein